MCYIDDIIIFSKTYDEHVTHVNAVLKKISAYHLKLKIQKCNFCCTEISLLGHKISAKGIEVDDEKRLQAINWNLPVSANQMQSFLGLTNYFRDFIPNYAHIVAPLEKLRTKSIIGGDDWTDECKNAIIALKNSLLCSPILSFPDRHYPFSVATDASNDGIGAMLFQEYNGKRHFISFASRSLSNTEKKYTTPKRELLAIVFALKKFHQFIWG